MLPWLPPVQLDGLPRGKGSGNQMEALVDAREEMVQRIQKMIDELAAVQSEVKPFVNSLPGPLHTFCLCYYYDNHDLENVAVIMGKDRRTVFRYKRKLEDLCKNVTLMSPQCHLDVTEKAVL